MEIENFCETFDWKAIVHALNRYNWKNEDIISTFFLKILGQVGCWTKMPLKLLLHFAVISGNPLF